MALPNLSGENASSLVPVLGLVLDGFIKANGNEPVSIDLSCSL